MTNEPAFKGQKSESKNRRRAVESFKSAAETIGPIEPGMSLFSITRGQFSMIDAILHCINELGNAHISLWTWTIADYEIEVVCGLMAREEITGATLVIDQSADRRNGAIIEQWRQRFGEKTVKICKNHAKIARVWTENRRLLLRGSMNLNFNPRFEQLDVTEGGADFDMVERIENELPVLPRKYSNADTESATKVNKAFELGTLKMFAGLKTWAK
jgi:hypothetical protein